MPKESSGGMAGAGIGDGADILAPISDTQRLDYLLSIYPENRTREGIDADMRSDVAWARKHEIEWLLDQIKYSTSFYTASSMALLNAAGVISPDQAKARLLKLMDQK